MLHDRKALYMCGVRVRIPTSSAACAAYLHSHGPAPVALPHVVTPGVEMRTDAKSRDHLYGLGLAGRQQWYLYLVAEGAIRLIARFTDPGEPSSFGQLPE